MVSFFTRLRLMIVVAALGAGAADPAGADVVVYEQPPESPVTSPRTSQFITPLGQFGFQTFDNFTLSTTQLLSDGHWRGAYVNTLALDPTAEPAANSTGFGVRFHSSTGTDPGALLAEYIFTPTEANETFVATQAFTLSSGTEVTLAIYDYDVLFDLPFLANAGTEYWLSIYAFSPFPSPDEAQWTWVGGSGGDGVTLQFSGFDPNIRIVTTDRAFALTVPEPATLALVAIGLLAAGAVRRRRAS